MNIRKVMERVTENLLFSMNADGFAICNIVRERTKDRPPLLEYTPTTPTTWDINNGWCEEWAETVSSVLHDGEPTWLDSLDDYDLGDDLGAHCALKLNDRWYDAECHEGVDDWHDLPFVRNMGKTREEVLRERDREASGGKLASKARA